MFSSSMLKKLVKSLSGKQSPITPKQGKRLQRDEQAGGHLVFTIKGKGRPGFFIIFGAMFGGFPSIILFSLLFGSGGPGDFGSAFGILFLTPFFLIGLTTFLVGLFLWLGKTQIEITSQSIFIRRTLFGKSFQQKEFRRDAMELSFEESHRENEVPAYKLKFTDGNQKIGVGGSLREEELLWLEREIKLTLGQEVEAITSVRDAMEQEGIETLSRSELDPTYRSKNLEFTQTFHGWEARIQSTKLGALGTMLFGSVFLIAGLMMYRPTRNHILDLLPFIREAFSGAQTSGGEPPIWFAMIFGGAGLFIVLVGIYLLGSRLTIALRHSRLLIHRRWLVFSRTRFIDIADIQEIDIKKTGNVNDDPRYRLSAIHNDGTQTKIIGFSSADDVGQLRAHLSAAISRSRPDRP